MNSIFFLRFFAFMRYCARPRFALERLSVIRGADARITRVRYVLPRNFGRKLGWSWPMQHVHAARREWRRGSLAV